MAMHCPTAIYIQREEEEEEGPFQPGTAWAWMQPSSPEPGLSSQQLMSGEKGSGADGRAELVAPGLCLIPPAPPASHGDKLCLAGVGTGSG